MSTTPNTELKKVLTPLHLWSIAVGLVISGEYFGWSYGWSVAGTTGFLISTLLIALLYTTFVFSFTELTTAIPHAGGPFAYASKAFGPWIGALAGYATLIEFLFAPPAIASALGSYVHFIFPEISVLTSSILIFLAFTAINLIGVHFTARFELIVTLIAVIELLIFIGVVGPHFQLSHFLKQTQPTSLSGIFAALPYAIWFFLGIEGVAMAAEEVKTPEKDIPKGYLSGIFTLIFLSLAVMLAAGGVGDWQRLSQMDYPVPEALAMALGDTHPLVKALAGIGLFGLVASLNGIIFSSSRQVFALSRSGILPKRLSHLHLKTQSPHAALFFCSAIGILSLLSGKTSELIILSALGAVSMYALSMLSLFFLRKNQPELPRPFQVPFYPLFPLIALVLSLLSLCSILYYHPYLGTLFLVLMSTGAITYGLRMRKKAKTYHEGEFHHAVSHSAPRGELSI
jgi:ethanolamine permease